MVTFRSSFLTSRASGVGFLVIVKKNAAGRAVGLAKLLEEPAYGAFWPLNFDKDNLYKENTW